jgi:endoglucanase
MDLEKHLIELSEAPGVSGYEAATREIVRRAWDGLADEYSVDGLGTLLAVRRGRGKAPRKRVLVTGHMDEIGLMVTRIEGEYLRFTNVGGIDRRVLISQPVVVHGTRDLPGLIGSRAPHLLPADERSRYPAYDDLVIDTGLSAAQLRRLVRIGAPITFAQKAARLADGSICGKAMDNRSSVATLTLLLHELQTRSHTWDVLVAATVLEEVGLIGGQTIAWRTQPDIAIVIDTNWATGNGVGEDEGFKLGGGPTLIIGPNAHPRLFNLIMDRAKALEIDVHPEAAPRHSGTEAWAIQVSRDGVPAAILSIPIRNMHMPVEIVDPKDIERVARLVAEFITSLDDQTLDKLALDAEG